MSSYLQQLERLPHRDLRGIATRLQLRSRRQHRNEDWLAAIVQTWHDPTPRTAWLQRSLYPECGLARMGAPSRPRTARRQRGPQPTHHASGIQTVISDVPRLSQA